MNINEVIFAGGNAKTSTLIFSVFASWMWTTSVIGAVETYAYYGILGPITYVLGACLAFALYVNLIAAVKKRIPNGLTFLDIIEDVYGKNIKLFYFLFAFIVPAYVLIEQAVGVAFVLDWFFGLEFKWVAFMTIALAIAIVAVSGMRGLLRLEKVTAITTLLAFMFVAGYFVNADSSAYVVREINAHEDWFGVDLILAAVRYFVMAVVIAFSQLAFDPAYYIKGRMARNDKQFKLAFYVGGIALWGGISLVSSIYLGVASHVQNVEVLKLLGGIGAFVFAVAMFIIGLSTISHYLMGWYGVFAVDLYTSYLRPEASEEKRIVFGRVLMITGGIFCALIAISLENISLLTIDVFCAIFFAAPCGPLLFAWHGMRHTENKASVIAAVAGIACGLVLWACFGANSEWGQFLGVVASLAVSLVCSLLGSIGKGYRDQ